jgi:hypothetical protein
MVRQRLRYKFEILQNYSFLYQWKAFLMYKLKIKPHIYEVLKK